MKKIIALLLCLITAISLFSCSAENGSDSDTAEDTGNAAPSGIDADKTVLTVGDLELSLGDFYFQFILTPSNMISQFQSYYGEEYATYLIQQYGFDPAKPYSEQQCPEDVYDGTFYDLFFESAKNYLTENAALYCYAKDNGAELSEDEIADIEAEAKSYVDMALQNYGSLAAAYGDTLGLINEEVLKNALTIQAIAKKGQEMFSENANLTQEDFDKRYEEDPLKYSVVSFLSYTLDANDTTVTADDVKTYADELAATTTPEDFAAYVDNYYNNVLNPDLEERTDYTVDSLLKKNVAYADDLEAYRWMFTEASVGECYEVFGTEGSSCTVFMLVSAPHLNDYVSKNVRHILFNIDNYSSDAECKTAADTVYKEYLKNPTEENFAALANEHSDDPDVETDEAGNAVGEKDTKTSGGLYENVQRDQMVKEFEDWCFDEARQPGDTGIIKTRFGYHIMYFVGDGERISTGTDKIRNEIMRGLFEDYMEKIGTECDSEYIDSVLK